MKPGLSDSRGSAQGLLEEESKHGSGDLGLDVQGRDGEDGVRGQAHGCVGT